MNATRAHFLTLAVLLGALCESVWAGEDAPEIEVFTDSTLPVLSGADNTTVYVLDRLARLQKDLSRDLPTDVESAKQLAVQRFQRMDAQLSSELENAATGLVKAQQHGIDRYPAIVFDGEAVVYGVTDINAATQVYQQWRAEGARQ